MLLDVDGTLAPIVDRPEDAAVPEGTRELLRDLQRRYALVACVSGRTEEDAGHVVGVDELVYVGEHGMGLDPRAGEWADELDAARRRQRLGARAEGVLGRVPLPHRRGRGGRGRVAAEGRAPGPRARAARTRGAARCWRSSRP